jgi:hypothetical protein
MLSESVLHCTCSNDVGLNHTERRTKMSAKKTNTVRLTIIYINLKDPIRVYTMDSCHLFSTKQTSSSSQ